MTPVFVFLLFFSLTAVPPGATVDRAGTDTSLGASENIARANDGIATPLIHGDIVPDYRRNADPCTATGCKWPKRRDFVRIPVSISSDYSREQRRFIINTLVTFHESTCIRFVWRNSKHRDYLHFFSGSGCWSYLGRLTGGQRVSLKRDGCLFTDTVQHEVLHALGFHHEHARSDRDEHVSIFTENIIEGTESNFQKVQTNNLGTPYDFNSVMHYGKFAFSKNGNPTIIAKSDPDLPLGTATSLSANDIARVNRLYEC
ncbi:low choriolytic enzyme-like [Trachinotus anak]|uniref:low choriolytic enzyme-like n=1 Tax=Trachinotus anak TaxID=443729 RepID=UPI0039F1A3C1